MHRTLLSTLVLAAAMFVTPPTDDLGPEHARSGCGLLVAQCPEPSEWPQYDNLCKSLCGVHSYPGGCGYVDEPFWSDVLWCYQPN